MSRFNGDKLRELRLSKNLTQAELSEELKVAGITIHRWETGERNPCFDSVISMSEFFEVPIETFVK